MSRRRKRPAANTAPVQQAPVEGSGAEADKAQLEIEGTEGAENTEAAASSDKGPVQADGTYRVALPVFEGPLDLLLHLIQQHELDIKDIPILFVSEKYVEYMMLMHDLNIDLASEYLVMAATLAHIKSKMLLPKPPVDQDDELEDELDPRSELVRRLLEYQKYKDAAKSLGSSPVLGRDVFLRGAPAPMVDGPAPLAQVGVFKLFDAFQRLLSRTKQKAEHLINVDKISISERIIELTDILKGRGRVSFMELFGGEEVRSDLIVSFLAVLEMTRLRMLDVSQDDPQEELFIELTLTEEHDEFLRQPPEMEDPLAALARGDIDVFAKNATAVKPDPQTKLPLDEGLEIPAVDSTVEAQSDPHKPPEGSTHVQERSDAFIEESSTERISIEEAFGEEISTEGALSEEASEASILGAMDNDEPPSGESN